MNWDIVGSISSLVGAIVGVSGLLFVVLQIRMAVRSYLADHERRKKQATIEYVREVRPLYKKNREVIDLKYGSDVLSDADVAEIVKESGEIRENLKEILAQLEFLAVGVNTGVFDKDLWFRMSAAYIIRIYQRFHPYIKYVQKTNPFAFIEFEEIVLEFQERKRRVKAETKGNIKYS